MLQKRGGTPELDFYKQPNHKKFLSNEEKLETFSLLAQEKAKTLEKGPDIFDSINYPLIQKLEKLGLIGDDITKSKVQYVAKIKIKNPDITIRTANIEYSPADVTEFKIQIQEMLKQNLIRKSESPHRSAAFIVRNHAEVSRGKPRIVYNYKRLNDNTEDDGYNIPNKDTLINLIQHKIFFLANSI